uniref:Heme oxygenase 1 n=1 Tax=Spermophilus dauricus TaxID=99837 RepID=A0A8C9UW92_SPEDA
MKRRLTYLGLPQDLSEALKEATKEVHAQAENAEFMRNFQRGQVTRKGFKLVMASLYHLYVALEEEIERNKDNPVFAPLYFPEELHRRAALEEDRTPIGWLSILVFLCILILHPDFCNLIFHPDLCFLILHPDLL